MTSPTLISEPTPSLAATQSAQLRFRPPIVLFFITMLTTTSVGMRYMYNFNLGRPPLTSDADILPFGWVFLHISQFGTGLPFSLTLIAILLAHEFGHYFACRGFRVASTLPYLLPAPSLSGSFGAVIRLKSRVRSRSALIVIGAMGPIAGFVVTLLTIPIGLALSNYAEHPLAQSVQAPLVVSGFHWLLGAITRHPQNISLIIPHPILVASWMGILITFLNLIPAGQLDGGHIVYAISPTAHKITSRLSVAVLLLLGVFQWAGWIAWGLILLMPSMKHPQVPDDDPVKVWHWALIPICAVIFLLAATYQPFVGYSVINIVHKWPGMYK
jgi:membrane-associated protease RseP (regulator of RpoE activity)